MSATPPAPIPVPAPAPAPAGPRQPNKLRKKVSFAASAKSAQSGKSAISDKDNDVSDDEAVGAPHGRGVEDEFRSPAQKTAAWLAGLSLGAGGKGKGKQKNGEVAEAGDVVDPATPSAAGYDIHSLSVETPPTTGSQQDVGDADVVTSPAWKHHDRYFPLFSESDLFTSPAPPRTVYSKSGVTSTSTTSSQPPSGSSYTFTSPFQDALTIVEAQALEHSRLSGRNVVLHYPALPSFDEFLQGKSRESVGWKEPQWGTSGWTGYGWAGEGLPDSQGRTFGVPMPEAVALGPDGEVVEKKEEKKEGAPGPADGGGGAEGGGKKKKKK